MIRNIPPLNRRNGSSLVEVMIAMTLASAVLSMGIGTLHLLLRSESAMTNALQRSQTVSQLARSFRQDVHAARSAEIPPPADGQPPGAGILKLQLAPGHQVVYATQDRGITRTETQAGETLQSAKFRFSPGSSFSFTQEKGKPAQVKITIHSPPPQIIRTRRGDRTLPTRELTIKANLGRDHRFETPQPPTP